MRVMNRLLGALLLLGAAALSGEAAAGGGFRIGTGVHFGHGHFGHGHFGRGHFGHFHHGYPYWRHRYRHYGYRWPYHRRTRETHVYVVPSERTAPQAQRQGPDLTYDKSFCREYSRTATVNGEPVELFGTACRQPDGRWRIID